MDKLTIQLWRLRSYEGSTNNGMIMKNPKDNILVRYFAEDWSYKPNLPVIVGIGPARPGLNIIY